MDRRHVQLVLRQAAAAGRSAGSDADLLRRFAGDRDEAAFAELVRRHGRLVWALCRNLLPNEADADDAFQATFLALARSAGSVRDGGRVGPWLHGVAYRVCLKAKRAAARRRRREEATAPKEAARPVADSAWDAALAAVHEEVCRLPESLRVPFVLCCLEGKGTTEAAELLGWKLGTLSGRLTRAKDALIARLAARGLPAAVVGAAAVAGGSASGGVPAAVVGRTAELLQPGYAVSSSILSLSQGVTGMAVHRTKLLAAAVLLAGGLTAGVGSGWLAAAAAQLPAKPDNPPVANPTRAEVALGDFDGEGRVDVLVTTDVPANKWEFCYYVPKGPLTVPQFEAAVAKYAGQFKAEFVGTARMSTAEITKAGNRVAAENPKGFAGPQQVAEVLVFKRPATALTVTAGELHLGNDRVQLNRGSIDLLQPLTVQGTVRQGEGTLSLDVVTPDRAKDLEDQIKKLQAELDKLRARSGKQVTLSAAEVGIDPNAMMVFLDKLAAKRFGPGHRQRLGLGASSAALDIWGDAEAVQWAVGVVKKLNEK